LPSTSGFDGSGPRKGKRRIHGGRAGVRSILFLVAERFLLPALAVNIEVSGFRAQLDQLDVQLITANANRLPLTLVQ